jgi:AmiR/NasT family two-component response regulator
MKRRAIRIPDLFNARAHILHRPHPTVQALTRQLTAIGLVVNQSWPELRAAARAPDNK